MISLPWPAKELNPNEKSWRKKMKPKKEYRRIGFCEAMGSSYSLQPKKQVELHITFYPPNKIRRDLDNCLGAIKQGLDGIAEALGIDDRHFHPITIDWGEVVKGGRVDIEIKER